MKIIIGWKGKTSRSVAEVLQDWLKRVIQVSNPVLVNCADESGGSHLHNSIIREDECFGILCLTNENHMDHGVLFDAGMMTNTFPKNRFFGVLAGLEEDEVSHPLQRLHLLSVRIDDVWKLVHTINKSMGELALNNTLLEDIFSTYWASFEKQIEKINHTETKSDLKTQQDVSALNYESVMLEMLATVRALEKRLQMPGLKRVGEEEMTESEELPFQNSIVNLIRKMSATSYSEEEIISFLKKIGIPDSYTRYTVHKTLGKRVHLELHKKNPNVDSL